MAPSVSDAGSGVRARTHAWRAAFGSHTGSSPSAPLPLADLAEIIEDRLKKGAQQPRDENGDKLPVRPEDKDYYVHYVDCE